MLQYHKELDCQSLQAVSDAWSCLPVACLTCRVCLKDTLHCLHHRHQSIHHHKRVLHAK